VEVGQRAVLAHGHTLPGGVVVLGDGHAAGGDQLLVDAAHVVGGAAAAVHLLHPRAVPVVDERRRLAIDGDTRQLILGGKGLRVRLAVFDALRHIATRPQVARRRTSTAARC
jgi:hypothetical protein